MIMQMARLCGTGKLIVVEPTKERREIACMLKADIVIDPAEEDVRDITMRSSYDGADVVIECAGSPQTARLAFDLIRRGGNIILFGVCDKDVEININPQEIYFKELTMKGSYVNPNTFSRAIELLSLRRIDLSKFDIKRFPLKELLKAFECHKEKKAVKALIIPKT
ncbi:MAG: zinc-binding dehydrogenase, partial [bacterium]|nr:zinc-binding dehydrogenase [bacterium]